MILDIVSAHVTDALLQRENVDRYDDREIIQTNLIESYERLMEFGRKHLRDKFFLEEDITQTTTQFTQITTQSSGKNVERAIVRLIEQEPLLSQKQMAEKL